jgi:hypothetical protein
MARTPLAAFFNRPIKAILDSVVVKRCEWLFQCSCAESLWHSITVGKTKRSGGRSFYAPGSMRAKIAAKYIYWDNERREFLLR